MVKKISKPNKEMLDTLKDLLITEKKDYIVVGNSIYEVYPFPVLTMMKFISEYAKVINEVSDKSQSGAIETDEVNQKVINILKKYIKGVDEEDWDNLTFKQFNHIISVIFKLNFGENNRFTDISNKMGMDLGSEDLTKTFFSTE